MKPIGPTIKKYIEDNGLKKGEIANDVGISYNYLSTIFNKTSIDASLLERICVAIKLHPAVFFDDFATSEHSHYSDIHAHTRVGDATVKIGSDDLGEKLLNEKDRVIDTLMQLLHEKERTIQILMNSANQSPGQNRDITNNM